MTKRLTAEDVAAKSARNRIARGPNHPDWGKVDLSPKRKPKMREKSKGEEMLAAHLRADKITGWEREYRFAPPRRWRADFGFPHARLLVEVEGGLWIKGRHQTGTGYAADLEKYNAATMAHWAVLRFSTDMVKSGEAVKAIKEYLA